MKSFLKFQHLNILLICLIAWSRTCFALSYTIDFTHHNAHRKSSHSKFFDHVFEGVNKNPSKESKVTSKSVDPALLEVDEMQLYFLANITIGTPPQFFTVELDLFEESGLVVLNESVNKPSNKRFLSDKHLFNISASTTYTNNNVRLNDTVKYLSGFQSTDNVGIGKQSFKDIIFGLSDTLNFDFKYSEIDGYLGANPTTPNDAMKGFVSQALDQLDNKIVSVWVGNTSKYSDYDIHNGRFTFGAHDTDHCESNVVSAPLLGNYFQTHVTTVSATVNGTKNTVKVNGSAILPNYRWFIAPYDIIYLVGNATNSTYLKERYRYEVDCSVADREVLTINIGGTNDDEETSSPLTIYGSDLIFYLNGYCYLNMYGYESSSKIIFLNNYMFRRHCLIYNTETVGFADVKKNADSV